MASVSVDSAQKSVELFQQMVEDQTISSLTTFDSTAILRCITIFMCAFGYYRVPDPRQDANERMAIAEQMKKYANDCVDIARQMEQLGFARMIVQETPIHLEALDMGRGPTPDYSHNVIPDERNGSLDPAFNLDLTSLQNQQMLGIEFDDLGALDNNTFLWTFEPESDQSYLYQSQQQYPGSNQPWQ